MRIAVAAGARGGGALQPLADDGTPAGPVTSVPSLVAAVAERERADRPRWVWSSSARLYPVLLRAGARVERCHDLELVESLLSGYDGRYGEPRSVAAAWARLRGEPVPPDRPPAAESGPQASLFDDVDEEETEEIAQIVAVHAEQQKRIARVPGFALLAAAESAGSLIAAEMTHAGLPWSASAHDELLTEMLGPRPSGGLRPRRLQDLADKIGAAFGRHVNPDSPAQIVKALSAAGYQVKTTRAHVLKEIDHPAVPLLLEYKELSRLHTAHGWAWLDTWVKDGRFRPEYVVGGVVSGRWATNGGGALQIPRVLRSAVIADEGWSLVVADAAQLEPRVLAALAGDRAFADAAAQGDLYAALADVFTPSAELTARDKAKLALLSAMYGGGTGEAVQLLGVLKKRFPDAFEFVEAAAQAGERGHLVRSRLGRTCPPPSADWRELTSTGEDTRSASAVRSRGRFTRNFVVQATAADWALTLMARLRQRLTALGDPHLVFFQHDEVIVHTPTPLADEVVAAIEASAEEAGRLLFGRTPVVFPMEAAVVRRYSDAK
ncbi:bifunctional 3'-5' exonuclease/DNA polymerase [Actinomadura gamaensis]|uniref:DNA-directed DNA polymerase n=1 Tax=Actinomadura gamaensis TaxID=1763541 RepID=A0ABV9U8A5_9ACTN